MDVFGFEISEADMAAITALTKGRSLTNPSPYDITWREGLGLGLGSRLGLGLGIGLGSGFGFGLP
eukprot:CAMPEP_0118883872 /NCGR_PEP_ID=MMETSP1163-20130328/22842_1 /TAXON_ID=124430 /ORGANISM="Phaeomonas parva, Strain CCMP2877" /LENGTH=64 /DNA_ID=CAMNT_0006821451 /DNA_START=359 /DNA_END=549 /DNA_ORIENTATION=-